VSGATSLEEARPIADALLGEREAGFGNDSTAIGIAKPAFRVKIKS
jgi:hypothetical protein